MLRALAIETSSRIGSVALVEEGRVVAHDSFAHGLQHAARLIPSIDVMCRQLGWTSNDLKEIYVSSGPGSFTGLRIGITLAKTLAFAGGAKVVAVPTVEVLVENAPADAGNVIIVMDAKRQQIFTAVFAREASGWKTVVPAKLCSLKEMLDMAPRPVHLIGEGIPYHKQFIPDEAGIVVVDDAHWRPRAEIVAKIGWKMARAENFTPAMALLPVYIRRPEAEEKLEQNR